MTTRRRLLATLGAGAVAATPTISAQSTSSDLAEETPSTVTRSFDEALLTRWRPSLVIRDVAPGNLNALYSYVARDSERDLTALSYWAEYDYQSGFVGADSHFGDHEPVVVFVDESTDTLDSVHYDGYHWYRASAEPPTVPTTADGRPKLRVQRRYHFYTQTTELGAKVDIKTLSDSKIEAWLSNDWPVYVPAMAEPWVIRDRPSWWRDGPSTYRDRVIGQLALSTGVLGAEASDVS